jgi:hypothetical protein
MSFNIDPKYSTAVQNFNFVNYEANAQLSISASDLNEVINEVYDKIITASQMKPMFSQSAGRELSLREVCFITAQEFDKEEKTNTVARIEAASPEEKVVLSHAVNNLAQKFAQVTDADLKAAALLFGIHRIHQFVAGKIVAIADHVSKIEQMEMALTQLNSMRSQFAATNQIQNESTRAFLAQVDAKIIEQATLLTALKESVKDQPKVAKK